MNNIMSQFEAILFDMDGVLIDSEELMSKAGMMALHDFGIEAKPEDFIPFVGRGEDLYIGALSGTKDTRSLSVPPPTGERLSIISGRCTSRRMCSTEWSPEIISRTSSRIRRST